MKPADEYAMTRPPVFVIAPSVSVLLIDARHVTMP